MQQSVKLRGRVHKLSPLSAVKYTDHTLESHSIPASSSGGDLSHHTHTHTHTHTYTHTHTHTLPLTALYGNRHRDKLEYKVEHSGTATHMNTKTKHHFCLVKCLPPAALECMTTFKQRKKTQRECTESSNLFFFLFGDTTIYM